MLYRNLFIFIGSFFLLVFYTLGNQNKSIISIPKKIQSQQIFNAKFYFDTTFVKKDEFEIKIISHCLADSLDYEKSFYIYPVCTEQTLYLYKNKTLLLKKKNEFSKKNVKIINGGNVKVLETVFTTINLRKGNNGWYFCVRGWSGCDWCTVYHEIFNPEGKSIFILIENKTKIYRQRGIYEDILKQYGIADKISKDEKLLEMTIPSRLR